MIRKRDEESLILRLIQLGESLKRRRDDISQSLGISTQQWLILLHLARDPNIPFFEQNQHKKPVLASEIAESMGVSRPNVTNMLNGLLEKGLIQQQDDDTDKRRKRLLLSKRGQQLLDDLQPEREFLNSELFATFSPEERSQLLTMVDRCLHQLENPQPIAHDSSL